MGRKSLENCPNLCLVGTVAKNKKKSRLTKKETERGQTRGLALCGIQKMRESPPPKSTTDQLCHVFCPSTQNLGWLSTQPVEETHPPTHPPTQLVIDEQKHFHCSGTYLCFPVRKNWSLIFGVYKCYIPEELYVWWGWHWLRGWPVENAADTVLQAALKQQFHTSERWQCKLNQWCAKLRTQSPLYRISVLFCCTSWSTRNTQSWCWLAPKRHLGHKSSNISQKYKPCNPHKNYPCA